MAARTFLPVLSLACIPALWAQDQDILVKGVLTDAVTGRPLMGSVDAFDELEADSTMSSSTYCALDGSFELALYSYDSSYRVVSFQADGHVTRRAVLDMTPMNVALDQDIAWTITMNVALKPIVPGVEDPAADDLLGLAVFDNGLKTIRWTTAEAREKFPVERMRLRRLVTAENTMDSLEAQHGTTVAGIVEDHWSGKPIEGVAVIVTSPDGYREILATDEFGVYGITLPYDRVYRLRFAKVGLIGKVVELDNRDIPAKERERGHRMQVDMRLFKELKGEDLSFLDEPIGRARYDSATNSLKWDMDLTRSVQQRLQQVLDRHPKGK